MMLTPCGPRAVPTGGAGVAAPACSWTLTSAAIFFLGGIALRVSFVVVRRGHREPDRLCHLALLGCPSDVGNRTILVPDPSRCEIGPPVGEIIPIPTGFRDAPLTPSLRSGVSRTLL